MAQRENKASSWCKQRVAENTLALIAPKLQQVDGFAEYVAGDLWTAYGLVSRLVSHDESHGRAWELLGLVFRDLAKPKSAINAFEQACTLVPLHALSRVYLAECYAAIGKSTLARDLYLTHADNPASECDLLLLIASGLEAIDEPHLAMETCRKASYLDPHSGQANYDMSFYASRCGAQPALVETLAWRAVELEPQNVHFRVGLALLLVRFKRFEKAHWVVRLLTEPQFGEIACVCCLERIKELFIAAGDILRTRLCNNRLMELAANRKREAGVSNSVPQKRRSK